MRVALLSAGPSLAKAVNDYRRNRLPSSPERESVVIGVNTSAALYRCDWWSCADECRFINIDPIGSPNLLCMDTERDKMLAHCPQKLANQCNLILTWTEIQAWATGRSLTLAPETMHWSATAAVLLAHWLGAHELDVFGVDLRGTTCCAGIDMKSHREENRWELERKAWAGLMDWARAQGMEVTEYHGQHDDDSLLHPDQSAERAVSG